MTEFKKKLAGAFRWTSAHPSLSASVSDEGGLLPNRMQTPKVQQRWWDGFRWRDHNPEDFVDEPDFLDRLTAARSARDPEFPARVAAARARLVAERVPDCTEQGRDQLDGLEDAFRESQRACKNFRRSIIEFEHRNSVLSARIVRLEKKAVETTNRAARDRYKAKEKINVLEATCARWEARAQVGLGAAAEASIDAAKAIASLTRQRDRIAARETKAGEKALLRRRMLEREIDDLDEYCELLERFASKKAKGKAQRKFDKRRRDKAASGFAPGQKLIVGPNTVTFTGAEFAEGCADAEGFPPLVPNDDADRAENLKHDLEHKGWRDD